MPVRSILVLVLSVVTTHLFADSWTMKRTVHATADTDISNPDGYIQLALNGTGFVLSNVNTSGHIELTHGNSPRVNGSFGGGGVNEPDSGDTNFQTLNSFALETHGDRSMGFVVVVNFSDGQSITVGSFPTSGNSGRPPNYDNTYDYSEITTAVMSNPKRSFTVHYYVYWDYESNGRWYADGPFNYNFYYTPDPTPPKVTESAGPALSFGKAATHTWSFPISDAPGVGSISCQPQYSPDNKTFTNFGSPITFNAGGGQTFTAQPTVTLTGSSDGYYRMLVTATSSNNFPSAPFVSSVYGFDTHGPSFSSPAQASFTSDGRIAVDWGAVSDGLSGLTANPVQVSYAVNGGSGAVLVSAGPATQTSAVLTFNDTLYGSTITFTVSAQDAAGNPSSSSASVQLPPQLTMTASLGSSDDQSMRVDLQFNLTPQALKSAFTSIQVPRVLVGTSDAPVTLPVLTLSTAGIILDGSGTIVESEGWSADAQGFAHYSDVIPVSSGAGHKTWQYTPLPSPWIGSQPSSSTVVLPNHQGSVTLTLQDPSGTVFDPSNPDAFELGPDRKVNLIFLGADSDRDHWSYEIDRVSQTHSSSATLTNYARVSGNTETDYPYGTGYTSQSTLITLPEGVSNYQALWTEGDAGVFHSSTVSITVTKTPSGSYSIQVSTVDGDDLPADSSGVITRPGEPLTFTLAGSGDLTYSWDFGDGTTAANVTQAQHAYDQAPGQTTASTHYTLTVTVSDGTTAQAVPLDVTVNDTQEGSLYKNETWRGNHTLTGIVEVPASLKLDILADGDGSTITASGGLGAGYNQGIQIDSSAQLTVADGVSFLSDSSKGWGTVKVLGTAAFGAADLQGADRAVAVGPGASVTLTGTKLHDNLIGLHVAGVSNTAVTGAVISNNRIYGIKEETGGRPRLSGTAVTGNFRNYYSYDQGLLTIDQINALNTQATTPNTGDANRGTH